MMAYLFKTHSVFAPLYIGISYCRSTNKEGSMILPFHNIIRIKFKPTEKLFRLEKEYSQFFVFNSKGHHRSCFYVQSMQVIVSPRKSWVHLMQHEV